MQAGPNAGLPISHVDKNMVEQSSTALFRLFNLQGVVKPYLPKIIFWCLFFWGPLFRTNIYGINSYDICEGMKEDLEGMKEDLEGRKENSEDLEGREIQKADLSCPILSKNP